METIGEMKMKKLIFIILLSITSLSFGQNVIFNNWRLSGTNLTTMNTAWNLGIGTTAPDRRLYVGAGGTGATDEIIEIDAGSGGGYPALLLSRNSVVSSYIGIIGGASPWIAGSASGDFVLRHSQDIFISADAGTTANMVIKNSGNLGIGTVLPLHKLSGYSTTATNLNAFNFINNTINKVTSTVAEATDTSSFNLKYSSLGSPILSLKGKTGNSMIFVDSVGVGIGTATFDVATNGLQIKTGAASRIGLLTTDVEGNRGIAHYMDSDGDFVQYMYDKANVIKIELNTSGDSYFNGGNILIGASTAVDTQSPDLIITGDADSDGTAFTTEALTLSLTSNATPTLATWGFTSTQGAGYTFDKAVTVTGAITSTSNLSTRDSLITRTEVSNLATSTGKITLATGVSGWGEVMAGDNEEWAHFRFTSAGVVTLITNTANVTTTVDTASSLNIYDAGSGIEIQNNLGSSKKVAVNIKYYAP